MFEQIKAYATVGLVAWAVAGPMLTYGATSFSAWLDKRAAVREADATARTDERAKAAALRQSDFAKMQADRDAKVAAAIEELRQLPPTPEADDELQKLCDASVSCRDRRSKK